MAQFGFMESGMLHLARPAGHRARSGSIGGAFHKSPNRELPGGEHD
jgi:hypothetical protein